MLERAKVRQPSPLQIFRKLVPRSRQQPPILRDPIGRATLFHGRQSEGGISAQYLLLGYCLWRGRGQDARRASDWTQWLAFLESDIPTDEQHQHQPVTVLPWSPWTGLAPPTTPQVIPRQ